MRITLSLLFLSFCWSLSGQQLQNITLSTTQKNIVSFDEQGNKKYSPPYALPLISFELNKKSYTSSDKPDAIEIVFESLDFKPGFKGRVMIKNISADTVYLRNVVPFGVSEKHLHITGKGEHTLSRAHLFLPEKLPINVIVPDNAWELGYAGVQIDSTLSVAGLTRRDPSSLTQAIRRRFETIILPGGSVHYDFYADLYRGEWQNGLKMMFQERFLYDLPSFDSALYQRNDLQWIRHAYVMHMIMAWDKTFYDKGKFQLTEFAARGKKLYGGDDVIALWPTWPTLGLDQRNQFDLFRDLPGGTFQLRMLADSLRSTGSRFFICYNPWDEGTRREVHLAGLADLIKETSADGVVLDTRGESSKELQAAADGVRGGVVMYSEGMAVPKNMPGIVSGRVHNALYYPPMLNLNKFIKPDFAIFRVAEVYKEPIRREYAISFFNGYGTEINQFAPGHPRWEEEQYRYLGRTSRILRENTFNFTSTGFTPLLPTLNDSIWVNQWEEGDKILYTIYSIIPGGFSSPLFEVQPDPNVHFVDLWQHSEIEPVQIGGKWFVPARTGAFNKAYLGTNNEGDVDCIARLPKLLYSLLDGDELIVFPRGGDQIKVWAGDPSYDKKPMQFEVGSLRTSLSDHFGRYEGKFVIQLFDSGILRDENIIIIPPGTPRLISKPEKSPPTAKAPKEMVKVPVGKFTFNATHGDAFIPYPRYNLGRFYEMTSFYIDRFPVTNKQFKVFLNESKYIPRDSVNFLKHWKNNNPVKGEENFPVTYVSWEDAQAYAKWAGKRLPTEIEWQYAAQTPALNEWPWKQNKPVSRQEEVVTETLTVSTIQGIDKKHTNLGDGKLYAVGEYPRGTNPYGIQDLSGCVWQLTNDLYQSGSYRYIILKGGSYFKPSSSWWYVQGGPRELHYRQFLLRVSEGFERNATVGFRCVKDVSE